MPLFAKFNIICHARIHEITQVNTHNIWNADAITQAISDVITHAIWHVHAISCAIWHELCHSSWP